MIGPGIMHAPIPGPMYWDYRCMRCGEPVAHHAHWFARLIEWLREH